MMKKIVILLMLCVPLMTLAQSKKKDDRSKTSQTQESKEKSKATKEVQAKRQDDKGDRSLRANDNIFIEVTISSSGSGVMIKFELAQYASICKDKALKAGLEKARAKRYSSMAYALNDLDQLGFSVIASYEVMGRGVPETHLVLSAPNRDAITNIPVRGQGNTMSRENPGFTTKERK